MNIKNLDHDEVNKFDELASKWWDMDGEFKPLHQINPLRVGFIKDRSILEGKKILDVGCGTGLVGSSLSTLGYIDLDGLDFSSDMLEVAREKRVYKNLIQADLNKKLKFNDAIYDAIICCGTFTRGHVGPDVLIELMRILKKGAPLACTINSGVWIEKEFDRWIEAAVKGGLLALEEKSSEDYFSKSDEKGFFCLLRKC